ncbi:MAG: glycosyltransferase [Phycisphaerae bacterium]|nr:glycosyltransferase [Phycisphaerae bacterium]
MTIALAIYAGLCLLYWLRTAYGIYRVRAGVGLLTGLEIPDPPIRPAVSVVVPACNEAEKFESAARTLLAQDYENLEIILVDDRSTDATGEIADRLAASDPRVRAIHISDLPGGWLGKVNALNRGLAESGGNIVLFTDADVHHRSDALRRAVAFMQAEELDHLAGCPSLRSSSGLLTDSLIAAFLRQLFAVFLPSWKVADPGSRAFFGVGAFNMVRRSALDATEGLDWLKLETGDDMGLGLMMKRSGAKCRVLSMSDLVSVQWYGSLGEVMRGSEKVYASGANCRLAPIILSAAIVLPLEASPILCLLPLAWPQTRLAGIAGLAIAVLFAWSVVALARWGRARILPGLLAPFTAAVTAVILLRAGILGWRRGGVVWRGTLYPSAALRKGRRVRLGRIGDVPKTDRPTA